MPILNENAQLNLPVDEIQNERQTLISFLIDSSSSMSSYEDAMRESIEKFKQAIANSKEKDEIMISRTNFNHEIEVSGYQLVETMSTDYCADGGTALYDAIVTAQQNLYQGRDGGGYMAELQKNGIRVKSLFLIFSDGEDRHSQSSINEARQSIQFLQKEEILVAYVCFGGGRSIATELGIQPNNIVETDATESELRKIMQVVSRSAVSFSQAAKETGDFFVG